MCGRSRRRCSRIDCACDWCVSSLRTSYWCACGGMDLLPGFFAGYLIGYVMKYTEKYVPDGVDLIGSVVLLAPLARLIAAGLTPVVNNTLLKIGDIIQSTDTNPIFMGIVLGGIITVVGTAPLSSMALISFIRTNRYTYGNRGNGSI